MSLLKFSELDIKLDIEAKYRGHRRCIKHKIIERRAWDIPISFCNTTKIKKELNWEAKISLDESIKKSWNFYNK